MSELSQENQAISLDRAKNQRLPNLSASLQQGASFGMSEVSPGDFKPQNTQSITGSISSSLMLYNGSKIKNTIEVQKINLLTSLEELKKAKESMSVSIASAYLQVLYNKELLQVAKEQEKLTQLQLERYINMANLGKIPEGQVSEIRAQLANDKLNTTQANNTLRLSLLDLSQLIELQKWTEFDVVVPTIDIEALRLNVTPAEEIFAYAQANKPGVKASELKLKGSKEELKVAKGGYYPTVSLSANYGDSYFNPGKTLSSQLKDNSGLSVGIGVSIPIFNKYDTRNSVRSAEIAIKNAELDVENAKKTLYKEIQQAWFNATNALEKFNASKEAVTQSEIASKFAEEKFNSGKASAYEYYEARMKLVSATSNLLQAKYNYVFTVKILDFYKGEELAL
jgi:outer membrane protein